MAHIYCTVCVMYYSILAHTIIECLLRQGSMNKTTVQVRFRYDSGDSGVTSVVHEKDICFSSSLPRGERVIQFSMIAKNAGDTYFTCMLPIKKERG